MANIRVEKLSFRNQVRDAAQIQDRQQRLHLFTHSGFEAQRRTVYGIGRQDLSAIASSSKNGDGQRRAQEQQDAEEIITVKFQDGQRMEFPRLRPEIRERVSQILGSMPPNARQDLLDNMSRAGQLTWHNVLENADGGDLEATQALQQAGSDTYEGYMSGEFQNNQNDYEQDALFVGMQGAHTELVDYFNEIRANQTLASEIRTDIIDIESAMGDWPDDGSLETFSYHEIAHNDDGTMSIIEHVDVPMTKAEAAQVLDALNGSLASLNSFDTLQMANLQRMMNNYQQAMTTISNIMKTAHETQKSIIGNARA